MEGDKKDLNGIPKQEPEVQYATDEEFQKAMDYVLEKYADMFQRLADK